MSWQVRQRISELLVPALVVAGLGASVGLGAGVAQAQNDPLQWCPGDDPRGQYGSLEYPAVNWDWSVCHTYHIVPPGQGNVSAVIWDGPNPPPPAPWYTCEMPGLPWNQVKCG